MLHCRTRQQHNSPTRDTVAETGRDALRITADNMVNYCYFWDKKVQLKVARGNCAADDVLEFGFRAFGENLKS
jgi:hypothetical protein